jgi:hypothetical protein
MVMEGGDRTFLEFTWRVAAHSSRRKNSTISSGESGMTLPQIVDAIASVQEPRGPVRCARTGREEVHAFQSGRPALVASRQGTSINAAAKASEINYRTAQRIVEAAAA